MRTPGFLTDTLFYLRTLTTISVLSIGLQTYSLTERTSDANTSGHIESLEVNLGELSLKATGRNTTESSDELNQERKRIGNDAFRREILYLCTTKGRTNYEETRQLFLHNVLSEDRYYNSNILGRYYRKDFHDA